MTFMYDLTLSMTINMLAGYSGTTYKYLIYGHSSKTIISTWVPRVQPIITYNMVIFPPTTSAAKLQPRSSHLVTNTHYLMAIDTRMRSSLLSRVECVSVQAFFPSPNQGGALVAF